MPRSMEDLLAQADVLADAFEDYEPTHEDRGEPEVLALRRAAYRRALAERELVQAVTTARSAGMTWASIGKLLGTSGEAARQRYANHVERS